MQAMMMENEAGPMQQYKTTSIYHMAYLYFKGFNVVQVNRKGMIGKAEVTFEGPNAKVVACLYHNSSEKQLLDSYIKMKAIVHDEV